MSPEEYIKLVLKTESNDYEAIKVRIATRRNVRILHSFMGIDTEQGELMDSLKKYLFYGKELDIINIKEELGDLFWYIGLLCHELSLSFEDIMETNIEKLKKRYGISFNEKGAIKRDLSAERYILEKQKSCKKCSNSFTMDDEFHNNITKDISGNWYHNNCYIELFGTEEKI